MTVRKTYHGFHLHPEIGEALKRLAHYLRSRTGLSFRDDEFIEITMSELQRSARVILFDPSCGTPGWLNQLHVDDRFRSRPIWIKGPGLEGYEDEDEDEDVDEDECDEGERKGDKLSKPSRPWLDDLILNKCLDEILRALKQQRVA